MNKIKAEIVTDSISTEGYRLTTMKLMFPRYILAELNTHRMISKNSASSRAKPFKTMLKSVQEDPFIPVAWMKDHKGMQGVEYFNKEKFEYADALITEGLEEEWLVARDLAVDQATILSGLGLTKQIVNRILEPFMWHEVLVTASDWENFFGLRCPQYEVNDVELGERGMVYSSCLVRSRKEAIVISPALSTLTDLEWRLRNKGMADIHIMDLAEAMWDAYRESSPQLTRPGDFHMPYTDNIDLTELYRLLVDNTIISPIDTSDQTVYETLTPYLLKISAARCARISYKTFGEDSKIDLLADIKLHDNLLVSQPIHASPAEHQGQAMSFDELNTNILDTDEGITYGVSRNFRGWFQYRTFLNNETIY